MWLILVVRCNDLLLPLEVNSFDYVSYNLVKLVFLVVIIIYPRVL